MQDKNEEIRPFINSGSGQGGAGSFNSLDKPDPTGNVLLLVEAAVKRIDDLRSADMIRMNEQMVLRAEFASKLSEAEAKRIDAIRAVDVNAVAVASERASQQATVLASQVSTSAETLRALVATTATANAQQLSQITTQLTERLASLEKAQYEKTGGSAVTDPQMISALAEIKSMRETMFEKQGNGSGMRDVVGWIVAGIFLLISVVGFALMISKQ